MKLIDADALKKDLKSVTLSNGTLVNTNAVLYLLEEYPTAYDVDRVVEQLEEYGNEEMNYYRNTPYEKCIEECVHKAIEIVKGGGANYETQLDGLKEKTEEDREL